MAVYIDPPDWDKLKANAVIIDCDGSSDVGAILEMERWAWNNGFARVPETSPRVILRADGKRVFRSMCYRLTAEERSSAEWRGREVDEAMNALRKSG